MWHLRRVHMESVGHPDARFDPLTVNLTDLAGEPTASILWLENMGGKTSWLSLVFCTLRPSLNDFLGRPDKRLGDYILATDTAHVVLEFAQIAGSRTLSSSGTRLLLGQVVQWKHRRQETSRESTQLARQFWAVVVPPTGGRLTFDSAVRLMHTEDNQRRPLSDYTAQLSSLIDGDAFRPDDNQRRWSDWLGQHGLDPEVFADQLKMSADEGSISERFHFQNGDQFVQWAMPYIIPPQVPEGIAKVVEDVRDTLLKRPALLVQQQFCQTVESKLKYAAAQQSQLQEQRAEAVGGWDAAVLLADQFRAAMMREDKSAEHHRRRAGHYEEKAAQAQSTRNQRQQQSRQAQFVAARLLHQEASKLHQELTEQLQDAEDQVEAWETTDRLRDIGQIQSRLDQINGLLQELGDRAEPLRREVTRAESRLAAKLTTLRNAEQTELDHVDGSLTAAGAEIERADDALREAQSLHSQATGDIASAEERLRQLDSELGRAVEDGLIKVGQPIDDAIESAAQEHERVEAEVGRLEAVVEETQRAMGARESELGQAREKLTQARAAREQAKARSDAVDHALDRLLQMPGLAVAFEAEHPDVWQDGEAAADRLSRQAEQAAADRVELELVAATDTRAVEWLHRTGLLPPSQDVEAVLSVLQASPDIGRAYSGWDVLRRTVPADRHPAVIARFPDVVNGVVLENAGDLGAAARIAEDVVLTTPVVLSVASVLAGDRGDEPYVVLPGPAALYDDGAAAAEMTIRESRLEAVAGDKQAIIVREDEARTARTALRVFLDDHPAVAVARWRAELVEHDRLVEEGVERLSTMDEAYQHARRVAQDAVDAVPPVRDRLAELGRAQLTLRRLSDSQAARPATTDALRDAKERLATAQGRHQRAETDRRAANDRQTELNDLKTKLHVRISTLDSMFTRHRLVTSDETPPDDPVDTLESALSAARSELLQASPPDQLLLEQADRKKELAELDTLLRQADRRVVALAETLLAGPSGATLESRKAALRQAKERVAEFGRQKVLAEKALADARADLREKEASPQGRRAPLDVDPVTAEEALELHRQLTAEAAVAYEEFTEATNIQTHHTTSAGAADVDRRTFEREAEDLAAVLRRHATTMDRPAEILDLERVAAPWSGTTEQAEQTRRKRQTMLDEAAEYIRIATQERDKSLEDVRHLANQYRDMLTEELPTLLPRLTDGTADQRGGYARELTSRLHTFALTIEKELADVERHRRVVIEHLVGKVKETVKLLERMQRRTRLPAGLEDWSDRSFLHLTHPRLPETTDELSGKVATVVDNVCADRNNTVPAGIDLLYSAVSAALGGPFHATILKPHKRLKDERVDIGAMAAFSGGQKVTVALVMFAALTRMRTEARSAGMQTNAALPLLLDNPIGKANQATLMEVQQRVADAFGLQLIYTTGLHDVGALASFKNIVRLDGRENPRSGHVHLIVDPKAADLVYLDSIRLVQHEDLEDN